MANLRDPVWGVHLYQYGNVCGGRGHIHINTLSVLIFLHVRFILSVRVFNRYTNNVVWNYFNVLMMLNSYLSDSVYFIGG